MGRVLLGAEEGILYTGLLLVPPYGRCKGLRACLLNELLREGQSVAQDRSIYEDQIFTIVIPILASSCRDD